jgi:hypothetical protein
MRKAPGRSPISDGAAVDEFEAGVEGLRIVQVAGAQ